MKKALKWILLLFIIFAIGEIFPGLGYYIHKIWQFVVGIVVIVGGLILWVVLSTDSGNTSQSTTSSSYDLDEPMRPQKSNLELVNERELEIEYYESQFKNK